MQIVVGFSTTRKWHILSWLIRKVEKTPYSHVYMRFRSESLDREFIYQASHDDLNFMNMQTFMEKNVIIKEFPINVTAEEKRDIMRYCVDKVGIPYGSLQLVGAGLVRAARLWFNRQINNPWRDGEKTQFCMELVGRCLKFLGVHADESLLEEGRLTEMYDLVEATAEERALP